MERGAGWDMSEQRLLHYFPTCTALNPRLEDGAVRPHVVKDGAGLSEHDILGKFGCCLTVFNVRHTASQRCVQTTALLAAAADLCLTGDGLVCEGDRKRITKQA